MLTMCRPGNPYDGHTLESQLEQVSILCDQAPEEVYVDRGYKGQKQVGDTHVYIAGQKCHIGKRQRKGLGRRNTIEPNIGHMKNNGKLKRCFLKGQLGDAMNAILAAAGQNIRKLLNGLVLPVILVAMWLYLSTQRCWRALSGQQQRSGCCFSAVI